MEEVVSPCLGGVALCWGHLQGAVPVGMLLLTGFCVEQLSPGCGCTHWTFCVWVTGGAGVVSGTCHSHLVTVPLAFPPSAATQPPQHHQVFGFFHWRQWTQHCPGAGWCWGSLSDDQGKDVSVLEVLQTFSIRHTSPTAGLEALFSSSCSFAHP